MPACSVKWCGKNSKGSNFQKDGITFHRYPKWSEYKEKWINATKRENWFPTEFSVICSRHFTPDCFLEMKNRRRLLNTAVPTLLLPQLADKSSLLTLIPVVLVKSESPTITSTPAITAPAQIKTENPDTETSEPLSSETPEKENTSDSEISSVKKRLGRRIIELSGQMKQKNRQIKNLRQKTSYLSTRVTSLKATIKEMKMSCRCRTTHEYPINIVCPPLILGLGRLNYSGPGPRNVICGTLMTQYGVNSIQFLQFLTAY